MNIITGYRGEPHITSSQVRDGNQGSYGTGSYILDVGSKMAATAISANEIRISDGALSHQGCLGTIDKSSYESVAISNGSQGMKRSDLIVCRYDVDSETGVESLSLVVIEGTPASGSPSDPVYNTGDIQTGDFPVDMPLYRVNIDGIAISSITRMASYVRTQAEIDTFLGSSSISSIGNGTVTGAISNLNSNKANSSQPTLKFGSGSNNNPSQNPHIEFRNTGNAGSGSLSLGIAYVDGNGTTTLHTLVDSSGNLLAKTAWANNNNVYYRKQASIVTVLKDSATTISVTANTWTKVAALPADYRPTMRICAPAIFGSNHQYFGAVRIKTDGDVEIYCSNALTNPYVVFNVAFIN